MTQIILRKGEIFMCGIVGFTGNIRQHRFYWMVCQSWNIVDMILQELQFVMAKVRQRLLRQKDV